MKAQGKAMDNTRKPNMPNLSMDVDEEEFQVRLPAMVHVPGGSFLVGTSDEDIQHLQLHESDWAYEWTDNDLFEAERPQHSLILEAFEIGQFPVTNQEYNCFISETGYRLPRGWVGFAFPEGMDTHPVVGVSKIDAEAYCDWLNKRTGSTFRLPSEVEWERAARSTDGRLYPWGNTFDPWRCNTAESAKRGTTPVGSYSPSGDSYLGVADMVGNVWEWTGSIFSPYPYDRTDGREARQPKTRYVIRGGSWYYTRKLARCAARESMFEDHLSPIIGFRLARSIA